MHHHHRGLRGFGGMGMGGGLLGDLLAGGLGYYLGRNSATKQQNQPYYPPPYQPPRPNVVDQLQRLADLRDRGVLTEAEFQQQKQRILSGY